MKNSIIIFLSVSLFCCVVSLFESGNTSNLDKPTSDTLIAKYVNDLSEEELSATTEGEKTAIEVLNAVELLPDIQKDVKALKRDNYRLSMKQRKYQTEILDLKQKIDDGERQYVEIDKHIMANNEK